MENKIVFLSPPIYTNWYYETPFKDGIGGSEQNHIEMSYGLERAGFDLISYAPVPEEIHETINGTIEWRDCRKEIDYSRPGLWILARTFGYAQHLKNNPDINQKIWVIVYDFGLFGGWSDELAKKVDRFICMSQCHKEIFQSMHPEIKDKVYASSGGTRVGLIEILEQTITEKRNPHSLAFISSPDRGLDNLIPIFMRAKEQVPTLELNIYYGVDHLLGRQQRREVKEVLDLIEKYKRYPGIKYHGKTGQVELYKNLLQSALWIYPTSYWEVCCVAAMDAQACGVIPIVNPIMALAENVNYGVFIPGDPCEDPLTRARYVQYIVDLATNENLQEEIRKEMIPRARMRFNWERFIKQWSDWAKEDLSANQ